MEDPGSNVVYPSIDQIVDVNRQMIELAGGSFLPPDNLRNRNSLAYILVAIAYPIGGEFLFPTLKEKAAALAHQVITRHVFVDGNKRTGIHIAWEFLKSNGIDIYLDETVIDIAVALATGGATRDDLLIWLHNHQ
jgi:death-on-curing protein